MFGGRQGGVTDGGRIGAKTTSSGAGKRVCLGKRELGGVCVLTPPTITTTALGMGMPHAAPHPPPPTLPKFSASKQEAYRQSMENYEIDRLDQVFPLPKVPEKLAAPVADTSRSILVKEAQQQLKPKPKRNVHFAQ